MMRRRVLSLLVACTLVLVLLSSSAPGVSCKKKKNKVRVFRVEKPSRCLQSVDETSVVGFYYSGYFQNGTVAIKDTSIVGRPDELDMSTEKQGLIRAIQKGLKGACNGEKRRVVVPPFLYRDSSSAAEEYAEEVISLDVHVVKINDVVYDDEDFEESSGGAGDGGDGADGGTRQKIARQRQQCGACKLFVIKFIHTWYTSISTQLSKVENKDGKEPPALTYNEDLEQTIQTICSSDTFLLEKRTSPALLPFCKKTMTVHKRQIAEQAMGQLTMVAKSYLPLTNQICGVMTQACPMQEEKAISRCDTCKALVKELEYDYTMLGSRSKALTPKKRVWTVLHSVCARTKYFHHDPYQAAEVCDDLMEDHGIELAALVAASSTNISAEAKDMQSASVSDTLCSRTEFCKSEAKEDL